MDNVQKVITDKMDENKGKINDFFDLDVWKKAHQLVLDIYQITRNFPKQELYGITSQLRRAVVSVTANIAEGFSRYHYKEKIHFYYNSRGSLSEVQDLILICLDIKYLNENQFKMLWDQCIIVRQLLNGLVRSAEKQINTK